ncbi:MAG: Fic family protein [Candidatus Peregrinibacteria bacterium]|nr:Fic family protein [Candidatus Peregrinibacteria bacterium]
MKYSSDDNYIYYPNTSVPVNKLVIKDSEEIEELETQLFLKTYEHFHEDLNERTIFDQEYLKDLHEFAFSKLYSWAGKYRDKNISKGNAVFCQAIHLQKQADKLFADLEKDHYLKDFRDESTEKFAEKIAYYMCELVVLHPFFELNGRTIRLFFDMIAVYNGYEYIDYGDTGDKKNNVYIQASKYCMSGDCEPMKMIILNGLKSGFAPGNIFNANRDNSGKGISVDDVIESL